MEIIIHSIYLSILVETGIIGFLSFISLIVVLLVRLIRNFLEFKDVFVFSIIVFAGLFLLHGFIDNTLYVFSLGLLFWFLLGVGVRETSKNF
ncbi:MAG: hypothetical protein ACP5PT_04850 [Brevinematia bacterium]